MEYNNAIACEVCGGLNYADDYGNSAKCSHCGWQQCGSNETEEKWHGISYPMLVPLSRAKEQYKAGKPFKATFEDFKAQANINGRLLVDIWDEVVRPCFMYCGDPETDYDVPSED